MGDAAERRRFWTEQLEAAHVFMQAVAAAPVAESLEPVRSLPEAAETAGVQLEFSARPHADGSPRIYVLRASLVDDLLAVADDLARRRGWCVVIEDGFRTAEMQRRLAESDAVFDRVVERAIWELAGDTPPIPLLRKRLGAMVAASPKLGTHMSASAIDVSVIDRRTGALLNRGGPYLEISEATPMNSPFITAEQRRVRDAVAETMDEHGFVAYPYEFWHFNRGDAYEAVLRDDPALARYGPVHIEQTTSTVTPQQNPDHPLSAESDLERLLEAALGRVRKS